MSVLIRGVKMPSNCHECPVLYVTSICDGFKDCPLVPVPPHGRLIDADALKAAICKALKTALNDNSVNIFGALLAEFVAQGFIDEIENAPTVIEEEVQDGQDD